MKKTNLALIIILLLSFLLRFHRYAHFPVGGETKDEFYWTWIGTSLLKGEPPTGWSWSPAYTESKLVKLGGWEFRIVKPNFDNPPLFSIIPGSIALLRGYSDITIPPLTVIRFPLVILGVFNVYLLYLAVSVWFGKKQAYVSSLFYATIPSIVFTSRMVLAENLLITWMLLAFFLLYKVINSKSSNYSYALGLVCGLAILTKIAGFVILLASITFLLFNQRKKLALKTASIAVIVSLAYPLMGIIYGWQTFIDAHTIQSVRDIGWNTIINFFIRPYLVNKLFIDGWLYLGLVLLVSQFFHQSNTKRNQLLKLFTIYWFVFYIAAISQTTLNAWYRFTLYPLMAILIGQVLLNAYKSKNVLALVPVSLFLLLPQLRFVLLLKSVNITTFLARFGLLFLLIPLVSLTNGKFKKTSQKIFLAYLVLIIAVNIIAVVNINPDIVSEDDLYFFPIRTGV